MPKYKAKNKDARLCVRVKLLRGEQLAARDLSMISQRELRGILKPAIIKPNVLEYTGPQGVCLLDYLRQKLTAYEFHYIMAQIVRLEQKLSSCAIALKHLITDLRYVYINPYTKELQFIYLPMSTGFPCVVIRDFMAAIAWQWNPAPEEDSQYIARFLSMLQNQQTYQPEKILAYIRNYDGRIAEQLRKMQTSMSGFITNKKADYYRHYHDDSTPPTEPLPEENADTMLLDDTGEMTSQADKGEETGLLTEPFDDGAALPSQSETPGPADTELFPQWKEDAELLDTELFPQWQEDTGLLTENVGDTEPFAAQDGTALLGEAEPTMPLNRNAAAEETLSDRYPYLIRRSMNERISINKPVFRIGKERSYVDYFISNNSAISRSHADIIKRGNRFFVCDRNSTNKTYRNGYILTPEDEVEIFEGDILQLANEEFEFHII